VAKLFSSKWRLKRIDYAAFNSIFLFELHSCYTDEMSYIFLDESGDLGFRFDKGSSRHFLITIVFAKQKRPLEKVAKKVHVSLRKKYKKVGVLHTYHDEPATRKRLLKLTEQQACSILAIVLDKKKVYTNLSTEKSVLYNYVTNILLDRLFTRKPIPLMQPIHLIAARRETNKFLNTNFKYYLQQQAKRNHGLKLQVAIATPSQEKALQIVDFVSWAIFRRYEHGDRSYYKLIQSKIIEEKSLFE